MTDAERTKAINRSLKGYRAGFTSQCNIAERLEDSILKSKGSPSNYAEIEEVRSTLHKRYEALVGAFQELLIVDPLHSKGDDGHESNIQDADDRLSVAQARLIKCLDHIDAAAPRAAQPGGAGGGQSWKVNDSLKPDTLTAQFSPADLSCWIDSLESWFESSGLNSQPAATQFAWFSSVLDPALKAILGSSLDKRIRVFPRPQARDEANLISVLKEAFLEFHPLILRQFNLFRYKQGEHQSISSFIARSRKLSAMADLGAMDEDRIRVFLLICGVRNVDLRDKLLELGDDQNLSLATVERTMKSFETSRRILSGLADDGLHATSETRLVTDQDQRQGRRKGKKNETRQVSTRSDACRSCGRSHVGRECPAKFLQCHSCGLTGHFRPYCGPKPGAPRYAPEGQHGARPRDSSRHRPHRSRTPGPYAGRRSSNASLNVSEATSRPGSRSTSPSPERPQTTQ